MNPVPGKVVARFGEKRTVSGKTDRWQGTVFSVTRDEGVHAVRDGKVVFADYLRGYGNLVFWITRRLLHCLWQQCNVGKRHRRQS